MRYHLLAGLALAAAAMEPAAAMTDLKITQGGYFNNRNVTISGIGALDGNYVAANFRIVGTFVPGGKDFDFYAFCVDLLHTVALGNNSLANVNYSYRLGNLTTAPGGNPLSNSQLTQMMGLAAYGFQLLDNPGSLNLTHHIPAIQAAIWSIEYGASATSGNASVNALIPFYLGLAPTLTGKARYIYSIDSTIRQGLLIPGIPEPATWAMLIAGFGMVGLASRRRRMTSQAAVAA